MDQVAFNKKKNVKSNRHEALLQGISAVQIFIENYHSKKLKKAVDLK